MFCLVFLPLIYAVCASEGHTDLRKDFMDLKDQVMQLTEENIVLKDKLSNMNSLEDRLVKLEQSCGEKWPRDSRDVGAANPEIGFLATVSNDEHKLQLNQPIIFDYVITNIGNAYDASSGEFTCSVPGTYLFNFNVMAAETNYVEATLMVNGIHIVYALSDKQSVGTSWDMGTSNAIIRLNEGDIVTVRIQWPSGDNSVHGNKFTTFSGYLLKAI